MPEEKQKGRRPDIRIMQVDGEDDKGNPKYISVGAMWKEKSKKGNEYYNLKLGNLKLLAFPNEEK